MSTPELTFLQLAGSGVNLVDLVAVGDSLVRRTGLTAADLVAAADRWQGRGAGRARRAARLVRDGVDSVMESLLRMLIVLAGLPEPQVNLKLRYPNGDWWIRFDLCYANCRLVIEYDGKQHRDDEAQRLRDIKRREELDRWGYRLVVVTSHHLHSEPRETLRRILDALLDCGATGMRRQFKTEWECYFRTR